MVETLNYDVNYDIGSLKLNKKFEACNLSTTGGIVRYYRLLNNVRQVELAKKQIKTF